MAPALHLILDTRTEPSAAGEGPTAAGKEPTVTAAADACGELSYWNVHLQQVSQRPNGSRLSAGALSLRSRRGAAAWCRSTVNRHHGIIPVGNAVQDIAALLASSLHGPKG
jgi:hypothetical protein